MKTTKLSWPRWVSGWTFLVLVASVPGFGQGGSSMFLLDLPGDSVAVRYTHGSLDRAVQVQDNFELMVDDFRGWTRTKVGLLLFLLSREEWIELRYREPYGVPEAAGGRGIALPAWGDDGSVEVWQNLLGTRLPVLPDNPLRGTPDQDHGGVQAIADSKIGYALFPCVLGRENFALESPASEPTRNQDRIRFSQQFHALAFQILSIDIVDVYFGARVDPGMGDGFDQGLVRI